ncbi:mitochondrial intermediate peptidase [Cladorrhinum sp. PSN259]|nr:mitochondrial intermediate peptidase [Cladorrhinum sp. PSN259]
MNLALRQIRMHLGEVNPLLDAIPRLDVRIRNRGDLLLVLPHQLADIAHSYGQNGPSSAQAQRKGSGRAQQDVAVAGNDATCHSGDENVDQAGPSLRQRQQRCISPSTTPSTSRRFTYYTQPTIPAHHIPPKIRQDDLLLRAIFDSPEAWKSFSMVSTGVNVGLFRNAFLINPNGFLAYARVSLRRARSVVDKVLEASTVEEYRAIVRHLDRLSDILCRVLDMSDFVRVTHPDPRIQHQASNAWDLVYEYMNELNTMTGLNDQLCKAMNDPHVTKSWSEEEKSVAEVLKLDFSKSAVNLGEKHRRRFVQLSSEISSVASQFVHDMSPEQPVLKLPSSYLRGMDPVTARALTRGGYVHLATLSAEASMALRTVKDPGTREVIYRASRTASKYTVRLLEHLMMRRAELANISGFESYGHLALRDRMMAKSPEAVDKFLRALAENNRPKAVQEVADILAEKRKAMPSATHLEPWDKDYYSTTIRQSMKAVTRDDDISCYFSLGVVMQGLSRLFLKLYGIRLRPAKPLPGETWHPDVRRLDVISDTEGHVAVLYCDLFYRPGKSPNPAHFTLRCSREIPKEEMAEIWQHSQEHADMPAFQSPEFAANDGMHFQRLNGSIKQLPTIALICDFPQKEGSNTEEPALLNFYQLETLFHEMGHAIHSILARTSFQNVSGTRCATDLAELPSTLMEYFAADPAVLAQFARHYATDEPLPYRLVVMKLRQARRFEATDTENQIIMAMLDQHLHSPLAHERGYNSTKIYHDLQKELSSYPPDPEDTRWQGFFGHLSGYGSTYYSYLFDRVLAQRVWDVVFKSGAKEGALKRENGEQLKEGLLKWGGARDPWQCLSATLKDPRLLEGGEEAMALVGSWGTRSQV